MSFRRIQSYRHESIHRVTDTVERTLPSGEVVEEVQDQSEVKLPDPEMFDINNLVAAGVDLQEVSSAVLSPKSVDGSAVVRKYTKKTQSSTEE